MDMIHLRAWPKKFDLIARCGRGGNAYKIFIARAVMCHCL